VAIVAYVAGVKKGKGWAQAVVALCAVGAIACVGYATFGGRGGPRINARLSGTEENRRAVAIAEAMRDIVPEGSKICVFVAVGKAGPAFAEKKVEWDAGLKEGFGASAGEIVYENTGGMGSSDGGTIMGIAGDADAIIFMRCFQQFAGLPEARDGTPTGAVIDDVIYGPQGASPETIQSLLEGGWVDVLAVFPKDGEPKIYKAEKSE
jgi:hypothetical protein